MTDLAWTARTPWSLRRSPQEWVVEWAQRVHVPLSMTLRDGIRFWLRYRLAQHQADAGLAHVLDQGPPWTPDELDHLLAEALAIGLLVPAYPHDPKPDGERPLRKVMPVRESVPS